MDEFWTDALTLLRYGLPPILAVAVSGILLLDGNPVLLDCAEFWIDQARRRLRWAGRWISWSWDAEVARRNGRRPPPHPRPLRQRYRLCSNGDHSDAEETRIVISEHLRRIWGAILLAAALFTVLSWAMWPAQPPLSSPSSLSNSHSSVTTNTLSVDFVQEDNRLPDPWLDGFIPADTNTKKVDVAIDDQAIASHIYDPTETETETDYVPPRHYRRPPSAYILGSDPRIRLPGDFSPEEVRDVVVHEPSRRQANSNLPPIGASGFAAARKAARAAQNAAADRWVLALRQRLHEENRNGGAVGLHRDDDELALARTAFGLGCSACGDNSNSNAFGVDMDALLSDAIQQRRQRSGDGFRDDGRFSINNPHDNPSE